MSVALFATGVVTILGQVVLLRELNVAFFGSELIYTLALGVWLFGTGLGALPGRRTGAPSSARVRGALLVFALLLPAAAVFARLARPAFGAVPGAYLPFPQQLGAMALALLPVSGLAGVLFQWAARHWVGRTDTLARAYAIESAGGLLGGAQATLLLRWGMQTLATALLCGGLSALAAAWSGPQRGRARLRLPSCALAALRLAGRAGAGALDRRLTAVVHPHLLASRDTPYGRVTVTRRAGQVVVFHNDALAWESQGTGAEELVHLAALQVAAPRSVLVLGGDIAGLAAEALKHRPERIDVVELDEAGLGLLARALDDDRRGALLDRAVRLHLDDPRRFVESAQEYDLLLVGAPEPASGQANRLYTSEFYTLAARALRPGGVLALSLRSSENLWTPQLVRRNASIHAALSAAFSDVLVLPGTSNVVLAAARPLVRDPERLAGRLVERRLRTRLVSPPYVRYLLENDRTAEIARLLAEADARPNTDAWPACYQATQVLWLSRFFPRLAMADLPDPARLAAAHPVALGAAALAGLALLLLLRRVPRLRRALVVAVAGYAGMVLETVLLLHYQVKRGVLFSDLGLLLTLFMAGLAAGSLAADRLARRDSGPPALPRWPGAALLLALAALSAGAALGLVDGHAGMLLTGAHLVAAGALVAALFSWASLHDVPGQREVVSPLYAADLLGGCLGSLLASLALFPWAGLSGSALSTAGVALLALLLV